MIQQGEVYISHKLILAKINNSLANRYELCQIIFTFEFILFIFHSIMTNESKIVDPRYCSLNVLLLVLLSVYGTMFPGITK